MEFVKEKLKKLVHKNYKYIEFRLGKSISDNIFDSTIDPDQYQLLFEYFTNKLQKYDCKTIISKNYEYLNKRLNINEQFQQRCFEQTLLDKELYQHKDLEFMITFGEKKMISIENFDISQQYENELLKQITSFNINNKFYLNFIKNQQKQQTNYSVQIYITKKNGKYNEIQDLIQLYLTTIYKLLHQ